MTLYQIKRDRVAIEGITWLDYEAHRAEAA